MAQLRVNTALQEDYDVDKPFQLPVPTIQHPILGGLIYPTIYATSDGNDHVSIIYDTRSSDANSYHLYNVYWDAKIESWVQEDMHLPDSSVQQPLSSAVAMVRDNSSKANRFARAAPNAAGDSMTVWFLDGGQRYPRWLSTTVSCAPGSAACLDIASDSAGTSTVYIHTANNTVDGDRGWKWMPGASPVPVPELSYSNQAVSAMRYGLYQDSAVKPDLSPVQGFYTTGSPNPHGPGSNTPFRSSIGATAPTRVTSDPSLTNKFNQVDVFFLEDHSSAPLLFGTMDQMYASSTTRAVFIVNDWYNSNSGPSNVIPIFEDVPFNRVPVWATGLAVGPADPSSGLIEIHALAAFMNPTDSSLEIWHTASIPGGVVEVTDGVYSVPSGNWLPSSLITRDLLSYKQYPFVTLTQLIGRPFTLTLINGALTAVFVNTARQLVVATRESETGSWSMEVLESSSRSPVPASDMHASGERSLRHRQTPGPTGLALSQDSGVVAKQVYYVDLTAVTPDGVPIGGLMGKIGSDSLVAMQINGEPAWVDASHPRDIQFGSDGKLCVTVPADGLLIPPSFWVQMQDMDIETIIEIQPSANNLHDTFQSLGQDGHKSLADITKSDGQPLVPKSVDPKNTDAAQKALITMSKMITENPETVAPTGTVTNERVYRSTSKHVARLYRKDTPSERIGRLHLPPQTAFRIGFKNGLTFEHMTQNQLTDFKATVKQLEEGFFDSIGDFFENVTNDIYEAVDCVVSAAEGAITGVITFVVDGVTKAWNFVLEVASQVAELASAVFDAISVAFGDLFDWLGWFFDWNDICKTQESFITAFNTNIAAVETSVTQLISYATESAFQYADSHLDTIFGEAETTLGDSSLDTVNPKAVTPSGSSLGGSLDLQVSVDDLPAGASWLLQKIQDLFDDGGFSLPNEEGSKGFETEVQDIMSSFLSDDTSSDMSQATEAMTTFFNTLKSRGIFDATTFSSMLSGLRAVAKVAIDLLRDIVAAIGRLISFLIKSVSPMFAQQLTSPTILGIYSLITGQKSCTHLDLCALIIAVPYNLLYKAITNTSPNGPLISAGQGALSPIGQFHMALGISTLVEAVFATVQEVIEKFIPGRTTLIKLRIVLAMFRRRGPSLALPIGNISPKLLHGTSTRPEVDVDPVDLVLSISDFTSIAVTFARLGVWLFAPRSSASEKVHMGGYIIKVILGAAGLGISAYELANSNPDETNKILLSGAIVGGVRDLSYFAALFEESLKVVPAGILIAARGIAGVVQAALYISAALKEMSAEQALIQTGVTQPHTTLTTTVSDSSKALPNGEVNPVVAVTVTAAPLDSDIVTSDHVGVAT